MVVVRKRGFELWDLVADWAGEALFETSAGCTDHATPCLELCGKGFFLRGELLIRVELDGVVIFEDFGIKFVGTDIAARVRGWWRVRWGPS